MVFKKLEYMGYEGQDKVQSPAGFAKLFTCTKTLVLRDTKVDLNFVPLNSTFKLIFNKKCST